MVIAGGKTGYPQNSQWVFGKRGRNMAKDFSVEIGSAVIGVDDSAVGGFGDGVDGQIATNQVVFKADFQPGIKTESFVALTGFALGAGQGELFTTLGMNKNRKIPAHGA